MQPLLRPNRLSVARAVLCCAGLWGALTTHASQNDIFGYTDEQGVLHLSNIPDSRDYQLIHADSRPQANKSLNRVSLTHARQQFKPIIHEAARQTGIEPSLLEAVIAAESSFNPRARSPKGALGLMQLMPATAQRFAVNDPFDPKANVLGGAYYLRELLDRFRNDLQLALAAYNAGEGAVARFGNTIPPYPETLRYVPAVLEHYRNFMQQEGNGFGK